MEDDKFYDFLKRILIINLIISILFSSIVFLFNISLPGILFTALLIVLKLVLWLGINNIVNKGEVIDNVKRIITLSFITLYFALESMIYNNFSSASICLVIPIFIMTLKKDNEIIKLESAITVISIVLTLIFSIFVTPFESNFLTNLMLFLLILLQLLVIIKRFNDETSLISAKSDFFMDKSRRDGMTGIYNNSTFYDAVSEKVQMMAPFCIIIINIDNFKKIKDTYGYPFGDYVLKTLVKTIKKASRDQDIPFRYGGDDIAVIFPRTTENEAYKVAEKIRKNFSEKSFDHNAEWAITKRPITISIGLIENNIRGAMPQELIENCDKALYYSKQNGKNKTTVYHDHIMEWEDKFENSRRKYREYKR
jgi:diguanylate cyclase (GGDEF)-like protein